MKELWVNLAEIWENNVIDAIEANKEQLNFTLMPYDELKQECLETIRYYYDNEMLGNEINYNNLVLDVAKTYNMIKDDNTTPFDDIAARIERLDDEEIIYCYAEGKKIIATFSTREGVEVEVLTPFEIKQVEQGKFTEEDIVRKVFELKQIANFKPE